MIDLLIGILLAVGYTVLICRYIPKAVDEGYPFNDGDTFTYSTKWEEDEPFIVVNGRCKSLEDGQYWDYPKHKPYNIIKYKKIYIGGE